MSKSRLTLFGLLTLIVLLAAACVPAIGSTTSIRGSGKPASREYQVDGFNAVDVDSAFKVAITSGDTYQVAVTTDDNLLDYVKVTKEGNTLHIGMDTRGAWPFSWTRQEARVTMPHLQAVHLNGASRVDMTGFGTVAAFEGSLDGASQLAGSVQAKDIRLKANGASRYDLNGQGTTLTVGADGASQARLDRLAVDRANVTLNGASQATVNAATSLEYDLDGASRLRYAGSPSIGSGRSEGASRASRE